MRAIPLIAAVVSTSLLAYFLLSERSQPQAQLQQPEAQQQEGAPSAGQQVAQGGPQQQPQAQPQPVQRLPMPSDDRLMMMILSSLVALNQANATGNYTVLRAIAAPGFQKANSAARLAELFANLRGRKIDLTPILLFRPKLYRKPEMNKAGMLRITGFFPTSPERVNFDLMFQPVQGQWRLFGIAVNTARPSQTQPQGAPAPQPSNAGNPPVSGSQAAKPAPPAPKPKPKPKEASPAAEPQASSSDVDVRDRLDHPAPPPPAEKPKPKGVWNPFGR